MTKTKKQRPVIITIICILGFIGAVLTIPFLFLPITEGIGPWYRPYMVAGIIIGFACMLGLWKMKKWGVIAYSVFFIINQGILIYTNTWNIFSMILPVIIIGICAWKFPQME